VGDIVADVAKFERGWLGGLPETPCGHGSKVEVTKEQRVWIPEITEKYGIRTVADIGAGDLNWIKLMKWDVEYTAYDLVQRHESVINFDLIQDTPPAVDMILCLWVLNHLPFESCKVALANIKASGSKYLMMTDRPIWHNEQPDEIRMPFIEELKLNAKGDRILLVKL